MSIQNPLSCKQEKGDEHIITYFMKISNWIWYHLENNPYENFWICSETAGNQFLHAHASLVHIFMTVLWKIYIVLYSTKFKWN